MTNQLYVARFKEAFLNSPPETFGTAYETAGEYLGRQQLAERLGPHANRQTLDDFESEHPQPLPSHITPEMVGLAAASHACGVAIKLAEERGPQGAAMTMRSYGAKNNFDRFTRRWIPQSSLLAAWEQPVPREPGYDNPDIVYPHGVSTDYIWGVAAPHRYLPAQTSRHLEFARVGILDLDTEVAMGIADVNDREAFKIDRARLRPVIANAPDHISLSGELGATIARQLLENGLSADQVGAILDKSYSIGGIEKEHGQIPEARATREALARSLSRQTVTHDIQIDA